MATAHYALFVDLENCGAKIGTLNDVIEKVKIRGDILIGKVYGYTDKYSDLKELLLSNTFNVVPSIRYGRNQKNNLDIQLVLDALDVAFTNSLIDSFCIVSGDSDYVPLVGKLKSMGKFVLGISRSEAASSVFINACNEFQFLESVSQGKSSGRSQKDEPLTLDQLDELICTILEEQADENEILASELKNILSVVKAAPFGDQILVQKAVTSSKGRDLRVVVAAGELVCAFVRHNDKDFKSNLHQGGYIEPYQPPQELIDQSIRLADAFGLKTGSIDYLFGEEEGEFYLCEVNSVPGISYVFKAQKEGDEELVRRFFSMPKKILHREGLI